MLFCVDGEAKERGGKKEQPSPGLDRGYVTTVIPLGVS